MSLIVKASSLPRGPKKDARTAQYRQVEICPEAECSSEVSRMHAARHLPGIFDDQLEPTEELMRRRISVLKICESRLLGSVSKLNGLVDSVNDLQQVCRGSHVPSSELFRSRGIHFGPSEFTGISSALVVLPACLSVTGKILSPGTDAAPVQL